MRSWRYSRCGYEEEVFTKQAARCYATGPDVAGNLCAGCARGVWGCDVVGGVHACVTTNSDRQDGTTECDMARAASLNDYDVGFQVLVRLLFCAVVGALRLWQWAALLYWRPIPLTRAPLPRQRWSGLTRRFATRYMLPALPPRLSVAMCTLSSSSLSLARLMHLPLLPYVLSALCSFIVWVAGRLQLSCARTRTSRSLCGRGGNTPLSVSPPLARAALTAPLLG